MEALNQIVNLNLHPINKDVYIKSCNKEILEKSSLQLDNFLDIKALMKIQEEAKILHNKAFYCSQGHTILLNKKDNNLSNDDPCNIEMTSDKGCIPHDLIPNDSYLNQLYQSQEFIYFIKKTLDVPKIFPYKDKLSSINYNYYEKNQQLGWHFDNASFAITLMIENADSGGIFEYINKGRDYEKNYLNKKLIQDVLTGRYPVKKIAVKPGTLLLFYGRNYLHRVTPVTSNKGRILVTLNYNLEEGIELSENARKTFFGRVN